MKCTTAALLGLIAAVSAQSLNVTYTTQVVTSFTTYVTAATTLVYGTQSYIASAPMTLTVTNCPCTISAPINISTVTSCPSGCSSGTGASSSISSSANGTFTSPLPSNVVPAATAVTQLPSSPSSSATGGANSAFVVSGAGLAGVFGLVAYLL